MARNILIIGSNSLVSSFLVRRLIESNEVSIAYSSEFCGVNVYHSNFKKIRLDDLLTSENIYDIVIILSAYIPSENVYEIRKLFTTNVSLIEAISIKFRESKIIFFSTVSVYSSLKEKITETTSTNPINEYGLSKLWGERIIQRNCKSYTIFRISSIIGVGMKSNTFIPLIIDKALKDKKIILFGNGSRLQNYIDVFDLCNLVERSFCYDKNDLLLAVGEVSYSNRQVAETIKSIIPVDIEYKGTDNSISHEYDSNYTNRVLNFYCKKNIETSIKEIIQWKKKLY